MRVISTLVRKNVLVAAADKLCNFNLKKDIYEK
jgi:hypothetical protein